MVIAAAEHILAQRGLASLRAARLPDTWEERLRQIVWLAAFCHDLGKCSDHFQAMVRGTRKEQQAARHEALSRCLQKLHARDRELVLTRYEPGCGVEHAAQRSGRSLEAAYKALGRIRKLLHDCVSHQLSLEGAT
jgi:DNA-directed RNA polymerase specialized sigma24 family protein